MRVIGPSRARAAHGAALAARVGLLYAAARVPGLHVDRAASASRVAATLDTLGGAYLKAGQFLCTRVDVLPADCRAPLCRLCDSTSVPVRAGLHDILDARLAGVDPTPFASGAVTSVHRGRLASGQLVAIKALRPDAATQLRADVAALGWLLRTAQRLPRFRAVPLVESARALSASLDAHLDLRREAANHLAFARHAAAWGGVDVPRLHPEFSTRSVLVMDLVEGALRIDDPALGRSVQRRAMVNVARAFYAMLFSDGLIHCDLHPGNILVRPDGAAVLIDFGYVAEISEQQRRAFASLFLAMALDDPERAAEVILDAAQTRPHGLTVERLASELRDLIQRASGTTPQDFEIVAFVSELFRIQRRLGLRASAAFSMGIVALVTVEGLLKQLAPDLDFQREALPYVAQLAG